MKQKAVKTKPPKPRKPVRTPKPPTPIHRPQTRTDGSFQGNQILDSMPLEAGSLRQSYLLQMQREQGNAAVMRTLAHGGLAKQPNGRSGGRAKSGGAKTSAPILGSPAATPASVQKKGLADMILGGAAKQMLGQAAALVSALPDQAFGPLTVLAKAGLLAFIQRLAAVPATKLVKMAKKVFAAVQSPSYLLGYLTGLLKGFFVDGLAGIFVLIYDLAKLVIKLPMWGYKLAKRLGAPVIMSMVSDIGNIGSWLSASAPALAASLLQELGGKGGLSGALAQLAGYLLTKAKGAATSIGSSMAGGLLGFFSKSKAAIGRALGHAAGRLSGAVLFEIILAVITSGGGSVITAAKTGLRTVMGLLGKIGKGIMTVVGPLGKVLLKTLSALKGWILAMAHSGPLKGLSSKLSELFGKLSKFIKTVVNRLTGGKKASATTGGGRAASTGGGRPPAGGSTTLPPPGSRTQPPVGSRTQPPAGSTTQAPPGSTTQAPPGGTTQAPPVVGQTQPTPSSPTHVPAGRRGGAAGGRRAAAAARTGVVQFAWNDAAQARSFIRHWMTVLGGKVQDFPNHRAFVEYWRRLAGPSRPVPVAFFANGELVFNSTLVDVPRAWYMLRRQLWNRQIAGIP